MKRYKPYTKSRREMTTISFGDYLTVGEPQKSLTHGFRRKMGRNNQGQITTRHKGGGAKRLFREIDFTYNKINVPYVIKTIEYDPNRSGFIGLAVYKDGAKRYVLVPKGVQVGDELVTSPTAEQKVGNRLPLKNITIGTFIYNVEVKPGAGAKMARSAGNFIEIIAKDAGYVDLKLPSTEVRKVLDTAWASIGAVSNEENRLVNLGKAGRSRWLGIRPTVRGTAQNPVDHPYGGGEQRQGRGRRRAISVYGKPTGKGQKSRTPKKYSNKHIVSRRKVGKQK
jgi:large subunit ribosomal protein L2